MLKETGFLLLVCVLGIHQTAGLSKFAAECLREHNKVRTKFGAQPLQWDARLAGDAQKWANHLNSLPGLPMDPHDRKSPEGENIAMSWNPTCAEVVEEWADEYYDYKSYGYCRKAPKMPESYLMHFTQLVWQKTTKLGVGRAGNWVVARYSPPGNRYRQYGKNVQC